MTTTFDARFVGHTKRKAWIKFALSVVAGIVVLAAAFLVPVIRTAQISAIRMADS